MQKNNKKILAIFLMFFIVGISAFGIWRVFIFSDDSINNQEILGIFLFFRNYNKKENGAVEEPGPEPEPEPPPYEKILLDRYILDLDLLFNLDQPTIHQDKLDSLEVMTSAGYMAWMHPYANCLHPLHFPADWKLGHGWTDRNLPISLPVDCYLEITGNETAVNKTINGTLVTEDVHVTCYLSYYIHINLGHVCLNFSIIEQWNNVTPFEFYNRTVAKKAVFIPADTVIGFSMTFGPDFYLYDMNTSNYVSFPNYSASTFPDNNAQNPWFYFTEEAQNDIMAHFLPQFNAMKNSGRYYQSWINGTYDINIANTFYGGWYYFSGGNLTLNSSHHELGWYSFSGAIVDIMNINKTHRNTFYWDGVSNFTINLLGLYGDDWWGGPLDGYDRIGVRYMYYEEGDNATYGVIRLEEWYECQRSGTWYMKYNYSDHNTTTILDDDLVLEYFDNLLAAQGSFTEYNFTYTRYPFY